MLETLYDITWNLAAREFLEGKESHLDSRERFQYCLLAAEEFEKAHPHPFGEGYYAGGTDETGDDYILAIDAFCDRKFKELE